MEGKGDAEKLILPEPTHIEYLIGILKEPYLTNTTSSSTVFFGFADGLSAG
jgi:hypothetical protein